MTMMIMIMLYIMCAGLMTFFLTFMCYAVEKRLETTQKGVQSSRFQWNEEINYTNTRQENCV
jgi:hypothetical protein